MALVRVAGVGDLADGEGRVVDASGIQVALFKIGGRFYATGNTCPHRGGPIGEGSVHSDVVTCPWHGWQFNVKTGASEMGAAGVETFRVVVQGQDVMVDL